MTIPIVIVLHFVTLHFLFDWFFQSNWMALNKGRSPVALFTHALVATCWTIAWGWKFWLLNLVMHAVTDQTTSQWTTRLWFVDLGNKTWSDQNHYNNVYFSPEKRHWFFVVIGFDQLIHYTTILLLYVWLVQR